MAYNQNKTITKADTELTIAVLKQFIYQVKSKMHDREVEHHLMPILLGPHTEAKISFINDFFCAPLQELVLNTTIKKYTQIKENQEWSYPVIFIQDMENANKKDMRTLKEIITSSTQSYRPPCTNGNKRVKMKSTFIGAANVNSLSEMTPLDTYGIRRYAPLNFRDEGHAPPFSPLLMWQSIDIDAEEPIIKVMGKLKQLQKNAYSVKTKR